MRNGTMSDRVSASTLAVQQNPVFSIKVMMPLVTMAMKNNQREAQLAITALKDLFVNNLMPSDRKLKYLAQQPVSDPSVSAKVYKLPRGAHKCTGQTCRQWLLLIIISFSI